MQFAVYMSHGLFIKWEQPPEFRLDIQSERCVKSECQDYYQGMLPEGEV